MNPVNESVSVDVADERPAQLLAVLMSRRDAALYIHTLGCAEKLLVGLLQTEQDRGSREELALLASLAERCRALAMKIGACYAYEPPVSAGSGTEIPPQHARTLAEWIERRIEALMEGEDGAATTGRGTAAGGDRAGAAVGGGGDHAAAGAAGGAVAVRPGL